MIAPAHATRAAGSWSYAGGSSFMPEATNESATKAIPATPLSRHRVRTFMLTTHGWFLA